MPVAQTVFFRRAGALLAVLATAGCAVNGNFRPPATEQDLATIQPGWTRDQVLARVGPPTWVFGVRQENLSIWNYRYSRTDCIIYQVSMRPDGTVRDSAQGYDPACDGPGDRN